MTRSPAIEVRATGALYFAVSTPCGEYWAGMTNSDDLPIQVRKALAHAASCEDCKRTAGDRLQCDCHTRGIGSQP